MFCPGHPPGWSAVPAYPFGRSPSISLLVSPLVFFLALSCQQLVSLRCFPPTWIIFFKMLTDTWRILNYIQKILHYCASIQISVGMISTCKMFLLKMKWWGGGDIYMQNVSAQNEVMRWGWYLHAKCFCSKWSNEVGVISTCKMFLLKMK